MRMTTWMTIAEAEQCIITKDRSLSISLQAASSFSSSDSSPASQRPSPLGRPPSDLKRAMRKMAEPGQPTFALTADVSEAHQQVPIHPSDWRFLCCQVSKNSTVYVDTVGTFANYVSIILLEQSWCSDWQNLAQRGRQFGGDMAHARRRRLSSRGWWRGVQICFDDVHHRLFHRGSNVGR